MSTQTGFDILKKVKRIEWDRSRMHLRRLLLTIETIRRDRTNCGGQLFQLFKETGLLRDNIRVFFGRNRKLKNQFELLISQLLNEILAY